MNQSEATKVLAMKPGDDVDAAYRRALRAAHPDTGDGWPFSIVEIKSARAVLLTEPVESPKGDCPLCGGSGRVQFGFGSRVCGNCNGTGEI